MNLTFQQKLTILMGVVGAATSAFGALAPLMTSTQVLIGTVIFGFVSASLAVVATVTGSAASQVKNVAASGYVEPLRINSNAPPSIAALAVDPAQPKIGPVDSSTRTTLQTIARS